MQFFLHYFLHLIFPALVAFLFFRNRWVRTYIIFLLTMLVDLDHVLAVPLYDPCRCSIGFHPLHTFYAIFLYFLLLYPKQTRVVALGLLMHMATDGIDCILNSC